MEKNWPVFSPITEHGTPQATYYKAAQSIMTSIAQVKGLFL